MSQMLDNLHKKIPKIAERTITETSLYFFKLGSNSQIDYDKFFSVLYMIKSLWVLPKDRQSSDSDISRKLKVNKIYKQA